MSIKERLETWLLTHRNRLTGIGTLGPSFDGGFLDSLGLLNLILFIEEEFDISVTDEEIEPENFANLDSLAEFVERKTT